MDTGNNKKKQYVKLLTLLCMSVSMGALLTGAPIAHAQDTSSSQQELDALMQDISDINTTTSGSNYYTVPASTVQDATIKTLKQALELTYETNPRIKAQRKSFESTGEQFNQALAGWLPSLSLNYNKGRRRNRLDGDWVYLDMEDKQFNIDQPIFRGGETWFSMDRANNVIAAAGAQLISTTQEVIISAVTAYVDVLRDRTIMTLSDDNQGVLGKQLSASQERFDVGEATRTDISQSQARLSRSQSDFLQAEGNLAISEAAFERVIGAKPTASMAYPDMLPALPASLDEAITLAQSANPRILAARYNEDAAGDVVNINTARLLPDVTLRGSMNRSEGSGFTGVDFDTDSLLLNVNVPLYQGGAQYSRIREAKKQKSGRRYELLETENEVRQQVIQAWENYQTAVSTIAAQQAAVDAADVAIGGVRQEQLYGSRTVLDVLDAEQELFVARVNLVRSQRNRIVSAYNLLAVTGQLSPQHLSLGIKDYDREKHIDDIKYQFIGF